MKFSLILIAIICSVASSLSYGVVIVDKGIYGDDNRILVEELADMRREMSRSIFAQIPKWRITEEDNQSITIKTKSLHSGLNFCPDEKFSDLPIVSSCSAFLVAPDLILTAGHCVKDKYECQKNYWVLDFNNASGFVGPSGNVIFSKKNVFSCSQILSSSESTKLDYALIKLNKVVSDRTALQIRRNGKLDDSDSLFIIGHPIGLPKILADEAKIRNNSLTYTFLTDADSFSGNSGSPVINAETNLVEGILVRGDEDFQMDLDLGCNKVIRCKGLECRGETVQRTTVLPLKLIPKI